MGSRSTKSHLLSFILDRSLLLANPREVGLGHPEISLLHYHPEQQQLLAPVGCTCSSSLSLSWDAGRCFNFPNLTPQFQLGHQLLPVYFSPMPLLPFISQRKPCQLSSHHT